MMRHTKSWRTGSNRALSAKSTAAEGEGHQNLMSGIDGEINGSQHPTHINALQIVHDAFYYMGFMQLAKFMVFLTMGIIMLLFHVATLNNIPNTAYFRTSITNQIATGYQLNEGGHPVDYRWKDVDSFYAAASYYKGFLQGVLEDAEDRRLPAGQIRLGEYGEILNARIIVNFEENCKLQRRQHRHNLNKAARNTPPKNFGAECWSNTPVESSSGQDNIPVDPTMTIEQLFRKGSAFDPNDPDWHTSKSSYFSFRAATQSKTDWQSLIVINKENNATAEFKRVLRERMSDLHLGYLGRYAYSIGLDIIAANTMNRDDYAIVSLRAQRSNSGAGNLDSQSFLKMSSTTPGKRYIYTSHRDGYRKVVEVIFWAAFFWVVGLDVIQMILALRQGFTFWHFITAFWNAYNWATNLLLSAWLIWYFVLYFTWDKRGFPIAPNHCSDFYRYEKMAAYYSHWVFYGIGTMLLVGLRVLQFSHLHPGVNVYHHVFSKTVRDLADFFLVFLFALTFIGTCVYMIFQFNGGNPNWVTWQDGISVLSRIAFQYSQFNEIYNDGIGAGRYGWIITAIFWLSVVVLFVFAGNIFLSAVAYAYQTVREKNPQVEVFLLFEILYRILFLFTWFFWMLIGCHLPGSFWERIGLKTPTHRAPTHTHSTQPTSTSTATATSTAATSSAAATRSVAPATGGGDPPPVPLSTRLTSMDIESIEADQGVRISRGGAAAVHLQNVSMRMSREVGRGRQLLERFNDWWQRTDANFYLIFLPENPRDRPRQYMLSRWALASRPELKALATHFINFCQFDLNTVQRHEQFDALNPMNLLEVQHLPLRGSHLPPHPINWKEMDQAQLTQLMAHVSEVHKDTMKYSIPLFFPRWLSSLFLGYFWEGYPALLPPALAQVYNADFMRQIESSFHIDEDEEMAQVTVADLKTLETTLMRGYEAKLAAVMMKLDQVLQQQQQQLPLQLPPQQRPHGSSSPWQ